MATQVVMPKLSPTMEEGQLAKWLKKEGDKVSMGEPLAEIETDKATMEMQALSNGVLRKIIVQEGETVPLGQLIAIVGEADEDISSLLTSTAATAAPAKTSETPEQKEAPRESAEEASSVASGSASTAVGSAVQASPHNGDADRRLVVSPLAARMAAEEGINLRTLTGSGPGGRVVKRDIESAIAAAKSGSGPASNVVPMPLPASPVRPAEVEGASPYRDVSTSEMRKTIARRLVTSIGPVPHFFLTTEIEMDKAAEFRASILKIDPAYKISFNDLIVKVVANSLVKHPEVNVSYQDRSIRYYERADIGVAVAIEDGLITPIVRSADRKSVLEISAEIREKAERARNKKLKPEEYLGATFSVSNLGMLGIDEFTAIINPPEAAIMAIGTVTPKPVVRDDAIVVRQMMRVTMSCDHRVIDGATGARFLQTFKRTLENPLLLLV